MLVLFIHIDFSLVVFCNATVLSSDRIEVIEVLFNSLHSGFQSFTFGFGSGSFEFKHFPVILSKLSRAALILFVAFDNRIVDIVLGSGFVI